MLQRQHGHVLEDAGGQAGKDWIGHGAAEWNGDAESGLRLFESPCHCGNGGFGGFRRFQKLPIKYPYCTLLGPFLGLLFNPSSKPLNTMRFFSVKTGTSPANSLTERRAQASRARGGEHEENRSHH
jgi:hypothetical protein